MAQGLGLGLSIVQRLVAALGLTLELDSVEGKGSRFSLYLPQRAQRVPEEAVPPVRENLTGLTQSQDPLRR
jgi:K+-sensing histidine kinase KdpD